MSAPNGFFTENNAELAPGEQAVLVEGASFCVGDRNGDIGRSRAQGLFVQDVRVLSVWTLTVDDQPLRPLGVQQDAPFAATFLGQPAHTGTPAPGNGGVTRAVPLVVRRRYVGDGLREDITLRNDSHRPITCTLALGVGADLAGLFDVKGGHVDSRGDVLTPHGPAELRAGGPQATAGHAVVVHSDADGATAGGFRWPVTVAPRSRWMVTLTVELEADGTRLPLRHRRGEPVEHSTPALQLQSWWAAVPGVETGSRTLAGLLRRSVEDIGVLRMRDPRHPDRAVVAAGAPWFMALFGRDSLLTSWMVLPVDTSLALGTLQTLADHQGRSVDPVSEEEPGRILHEVRFGRATPFGDAGVYYGSVDATALFVLLAVELRRWRGAGPETDALLPNVDAALAWLQRHTEGPTGLVAYSRHSPHGLLNQGWKDSWDGINFADGTLPEAPIALAEVQAYAYAAYFGRAAWADELGDTAGAARWREAADRLRRRFTELFWLPERGWYAVAVDGAGRPVDALASNLGHCLWCGIVDDDKAAAVAAALVSPDLFSGWGVRTLAASMGAYDPLSYHNGSVWPHDTAIAVAGLMRYGFRDEAARIASGLLDAGDHLTRLPELFAGFPRAAFHDPVPFPTACSPQAWASAAPLLLMRSLLGLEPDAAAGLVVRDPAVPAQWLPLRVRRVRAGGAEYDIAVETDGSVRVTRR